MPDFSTKCVTLKRCGLGRRREVRGGRWIHFRPFLTHKPQMKQAPVLPPSLFKHTLCFISDVTSIWVPQDALYIVCNIVLFFFSKSTFSHPITSDRASRTQSLQWCTHTASSKSRHCTYPFLGVRLVALVIWPLALLISLPPGLERERHQK